MVFRHILYIVPTHHSRHEPSAAADTKPRACARRVLGNIHLPARTSTNINTVTVAISVHPENRLAAKMQGCYVVCERGQLSLWGLCQLQSWQLPAVPCLGNLRFCCLKQSTEASVDRLPWFGLHGNGTQRWRVRRRFWGLRRRLWGTLIRAGGLQGVGM